MVVLAVGEQVKTVPLNSSYTSFASPEMLTGSEGDSRVSHDMSSARRCGCRNPRRRDGESKTVFPERFAGANNIEQASGAQDVLDE